MEAARAQAVATRAAASGGGGGGGGDRDERGEGCGGVGGDEREWLEDGSRARGEAMVATTSEAEAKKKRRGDEASTGGEARERRRGRLWGDSRDTRGHRRCVDGDATPRAGAGGVFEGGDQGSADATKLFGSASGAATSRRGRHCATKLRARDRRHAMERSGFGKTSPSLARRGGDAGGGVAVGLTVRPSASRASTTLRAVTTGRSRARSQPTIHMPTSLPISHRSRGARVACTLVLLFGGGAPYSRRGVSLLSPIAEECRKIDRALLLLVITHSHSAPTPRTRRGSQSVHSLFAPHNTYNKKPASRPTTTRRPIDRLDSLSSPSLRSFRPRAPRPRARPRRRQQTQNRPAGRRPGRLGRPARHRG